MQIKKFTLICIPVFALAIWREATVLQALVISAGISFFLIIIFALVFESFLEPIYKWLGKK